MPKNRLTRRRFLCASALGFALGPLFRSPKSALAQVYPHTIKVLVDAYESEITASRHYRSYSRQALLEDYPNIAYMFTAFEISEKIHALNYLFILHELGARIDGPMPPIEIAQTPDNLKVAAQKEMQKIRNGYPRFLTLLKAESHQSAILNCTFALKSHRQHEREIRKIAKYAGLFFNAVAEKIETKRLDFHVCTICGSTLDQPCTTPCEICEYPPGYYKKISRPQSS